MNNCFLFLLFFVIIYTLLWIVISSTTPFIRIFNFFNSTHDNKQQFRFISSCLFVFFFFFKKININTFLKNNKKQKMCIIHFELTTSNSLGMSVSVVSDDIINLMWNSCNVLCCNLNAWPYFVDKFDIKSILF